MGLPGARGWVSRDPVVADPPLRGVQSGTGLTGDMRSGGAANEERGEKKHVVRGHGLPTVHGVRNLKRRNELLCSRGRATLKTKQLEITGVQQEYGRAERTRKAESHDPVLHGFRVHRGGRTRNPRGQRNGDKSTGYLGHGGKGGRAQLYRGPAFSVAEAGVVS